MALWSRIYFNAVYGGLGGLVGWMLFGIFGDKNAPQDRVTGQLLLGGALIGGAIGYFLVSVEALRDRSLVRFVRLASYGVILGLVGGALGMAVLGSVGAAVYRHGMADAPAAARETLGGAVASVHGRDLETAFSAFTRGLDCAALCAAALMAGAALLALTLLRARRGGGSAPSGR